MPNRLIREGFLDSEAVQSLSDWEERVFHRLLIAADDAGRADGRAEMLRARLLPLDSSRRTKDVADAILRLSEKGLIRLYEVKGKPYVQVMKWQHCSNARLSKFPGPDGSFEIALTPRDTRDGLKNFVSSSITDSPLEGLTGGRPLPPEAMPKGSRRDSHGIPNRSARDLDSKSSERTETNTETNTETETADEPPPSPPPKTKRRVREAPPSVEEVMAHVREKGYHFDPSLFHAKHEAIGWRDRNGNALLNWRAACVAWEQFEVRGHRFQSPPAMPGAHPAGQRKLTDPEAPPFVVRAREAMAAGRTPSDEEMEPVTAWLSGEART